MNCDHMLVPSPLLMNTVPTPCACASEMIELRLPPAELDSIQIHMPRPSKGRSALPAGTVKGGGTVPVLVAWALAAWAAGRGKPAAAVAPRHAHRQIRIRIWRDASRLRASARISVTDRSNTDQNRWVVSKLRWAPEARCAAGRLETA